MIRKIDNQRILSILPHAHPFVMVDYIEIMSEECNAHGYRAFGSGEPFFPGHFPGFPVVPGVLLLESMAQTVYLTVYDYIRFEHKTPVLLTGIDKARFKQGVYPGDLLKIVVSPVKIPHRKSVPLISFNCEAYVNDEIAVTAKITAFCRFDKFEKADNKEE